MNGLLGRSAFEYAGLMAVCSRRRSIARCMHCNLRVAVGLMLGIAGVFTGDSYFIMNTKLNKEIKNVKRVWRKD